MQLLKGAEVTGEVGKIEKTFRVTLLGALSTKRNFPEPSRTNLPLATPTPRYNPYLLSHRSAVALESFAGLS